MIRLFKLQTRIIFIFLILPAFFPFNLFGWVGIILAILWAAFFTFCFYSLANCLFTKLPGGHDLNISRFNFYFLWILFYLVCVFIVFDGGYHIDQDNYGEYGWSAFIIIPLHLFTMYCIFYGIGFIAKEIVTIEKQKVVALEDYAGIFFLLWFFPIGIWIIHPKVRRIFSNPEQSISTRKV